MGGAGGSGDAVGDENGIVAVGAAVGFASSQISDR